MLQLVCIHCSYPMNPGSCWLLSLLLVSYVSYAKKIIEDFFYHNPSLPYKPLPPHSLKSLCHSIIGMNHKRHVYIAVLRHRLWFYHDFSMIYLILLHCFVYLLLVFHSHFSMLLLDKNIAILWFISIVSSMYDEVMSW